MTRFLLRSFAAAAGSLLVTIGSAQNGPIQYSPAAEAYRAFTIQQLGLNSARLNLTKPQRAEINKIIAAFVEEEMALSERLPAEGRRSEQAVASRKALQANLTNAVGKVMNDDQRATWETERRKMVARPGDSALGAPR